MGRLWNVASSLKGTYLTQTSAIRTSSGDVGQLCLPWYWSSDTSRKPALFSDVVVQLLSCVWLWPHGLQHARLPSPLLSPGVCSNSYPFSPWCHSAISSSIISFSFAFSLSHDRVFSSELALWIRWPKYWSFSFSINPSNETSGLISFGIDWFLSPCSPRDFQEMYNPKVQEGRGQ